MPGPDSTIKAGAQRQLISILQPVRAGYSTSGTQTVLTPFAIYVPAEISPAAARDIVRSGQTVTQTEIPITMRWMPGIQSNFIIQRLESQNGVYTVQAQYIVKGILNVDERNRKMTLVCLGIGLNQ